MHTTLLLLSLLLPGCGLFGDSKTEAPKADAKASDKGDIPAPEDVAAPPSDATKTASGLAYKILTKGAGGEKPTEWDKVEVHYTGWTTDGKMFDSSVKRGKPATFGLKQVIPGWTEGLQLMGPGDKARFWIPVDLAYKNQPGKPAGMLVFDVELISVKQGVRPPAAPADVAAPPADATKTASGLAYKILTKGSGTAHPTATDKVEVIYTGWTTDGKMFDSSVTRGRPATFGLDQVIPGWTEGIQLMVEGDKALFWIPTELAYNNQPGKPAGMLVFEVELLDIRETPKTPPDVAAPPKDAKKTASGLAYKVLSKGAGGEKPGPTSRVEVNYSGWTTDGKLFDSSLTRGKPATFGLNQVIPGWTEGLQLMSAGDKVRFWIPVELAYNNQPGKPAGMLVFDVELISIKEASSAPPRTAVPSGPSAVPQGGNPMNVKRAEPGEKK